MDITELLGVSKPVVDQTPELSPQQDPVEIYPVEDVDVIAEEHESAIEDTGLQVTGIVAGLEGLYSMLGRETTGVYAFSNLTGCETYANSLMGVDGTDLTRVSGMEGFVDSIVNGFKSVIEWIKNALKSVWDFFFGKSADQKMDEAVKSYNSAIEDWNKEAKSLDGKVDLDDADKAKLKAHAVKMRDLTKEVIEGNKKASGILISFNNLEALHKIYDDHAEGRTGPYEFASKLANENSLVKNIHNDALAKAKDDAEKAKKKVDKASSDVNSLKEDDKSKKAEIRKDLDEAKETTKSAQQKAKAGKLAETAARANTSIINAVLAKAKKKKVKKD